MRWDESRDVVIVGSGNGGLTAALCLYEMGVRDVLVIDGADSAGGTSAMSGGGIWIPNNMYAQKSGAEDSYEEALGYVLATDPEETVPRPLVEAYLRNGPRMLQFLHERTRVRYRSLAHYPDYFSELAGSRAGHRSLEPEPVAMNRLRDRGRRVLESHPILSMLRHIPMTQIEAHIFNVQAPGWRLLAAKLAAQYLLDIPQRLRTRQSRRATCGRAGVARLLWSIEEREINVSLATEMVDLVTTDGRICGVIVREHGKVRRIECRRGVVLASGGFEHNQALRERHLPKPTHHGWSTTHKGNRGHPIEAARHHGAAVRNMDGAWWVPTFRVPGVSHAYPSIMEKSYPGSCVVNRDGRRVANESMNYQIYVRECHRAQAAGVDVSALWLIFDARFRRNYIVSPILSGRLMPDWMIPKGYFCSDFLTKAASLEQLADRVGIDREGLFDTIGRMNRFAATGIDEDFGRGASEYDRYYGDAAVRPNPCLAPIARGPFYAIRIYLGEFGTNGGLVISPHGEVMGTDGRAMAGLYATGNCSAATLPAYPGPGSTLGPAMTFAYQAAKHISGYNEPDDPTPLADLPIARRALAAA